MTEDPFYERRKALFDAQVGQTSIKYYWPDGTVSDSPYDTMRAWEEDHVVAQDEVGPYRVSTIWLMFDHGHAWHEGARPLIFETVVFPQDSYSTLAMERYSTKEEALAGHARFVEEFRLIR